MGWTDEELDAAYDAYQGGSSGGWSDAELDAAWDAAQPTYSGPSINPFSDNFSPLSALTSSDWWLTRPSGERISAEQAVVGPVASVGRALNPLFDEGVSAVNAAIDATSPDVTFGDAYTQRLNAIRGQTESFDEAAQYIDTPLKVFAAIKGLPMPDVMSKASGVVPALKNIGKASGIGALLSAGYGFGEGEGGFEQRIAAADDAILPGAAFGAGAQTLGEGLTGWMRRAATKYSDASDSVLEKGLGIQYGDRTKGLNRVNLYVDDAGNTVPFDKLDDAVAIEAPIQQQVKVLQDSGLLKDAPNDVQGLKIHVAKKGKEIGKTIPAMVKAADEAMAGNNVPVEFTNTQRFLGGYRESTRAKLVDTFNDVIADYEKTPGTGLTKLTKFTDQLQKETKFDTAIPNEITQLKRTIQYDLRKAAEKAFDEALPAQSGAFAKANEIYSAAQAIGKTLNKPLARQKPTFGDYLKGGSLPMTVATGALSAPFGLGPAAVVTGAKLGANALKEYSEAAYPITMSKLYGKVGQGAGRAHLLAQTAAKSSLPAIGAPLIGGSPDGNKSSLGANQSTPKDKSPGSQQSLKSTPSIQSDRDFIASKVDKAMDIEAPKIIQTSRTLSADRKRPLTRSEVDNLGKNGPPHVQAYMERRVRDLMQSGKSEEAAKDIVYEEMKGGVNAPVDNFIDKEEGGQRAKAYRPKVSGSGVTVATGVDLGNRTEYELKHLGLNTDLIEKLKPYLGKKDKLADAILERRPLRLSKAEASELDTAVKKDIKESVSKRLAKEGVELTSLPVEAQTVVQSLAYNFGPALDNALPTIWKAIIAEDWARVQELLRSTKWKQPELKPRRLREAALLNPLVTV